MFFSSRGFRLYKVFKACSSWYPFGHPIQTADKNVELDIQAQLEEPDSELLSASPLDDDNECAFARWTGSLASGLFR